MYNTKPGQMCKKTKSEKCAVAEINRVCKPYVHYFSPLRVTEGEWGQTDIVDILLHNVYNIYRKGFSCFT